MGTGVGTGSGVGTGTGVVSGNGDQSFQEGLSWSSVGGYDHPQPGSRLLQYGTCSCSYSCSHVCTFYLCYD